MNTTQNTKMLLEGRTEKRKNVSKKVVVTRIDLKLDMYSLKLLLFVLFLLLTNIFCSASASISLVNILKAVDN